MSDYDEIYLLNETDPGTSKRESDAKKQARKERQATRRMNTLIEGQDEANELSRMKMGMDYHMGIAGMKQNIESSRRPVRTISSEDIRNARRRR